LVNRLADPFKDTALTHVVELDAMGFALGGSGSASYRGRAWGGRECHQRRPSGTKKWGAWASRCKAPWITRRF